MGLRIELGRRLQAEIYWAEPLRDVPTPEDDDLQDDGVHFRFAVSL
jgi:hypothetical protein